MQLYKYEPTGVITAGAEWTGNTNRIVGALLNQILVVSSSATTVFDFTLVDKKDRTIRKFSNVRNVLNDLTPTPVTGIYTATISNATADESFTVYLCCRED